MVMLSILPVKEELSVAQPLSKLNVTLSTMIGGIVERAKHSLYTKNIININITMIVILRKFLPNKVRIISFNIL